MARQVPSPTVLRVRTPGADTYTDTLRDGSEILIRQVSSTDADALLTFMRSLSPESRQLRFFTAASDVERAARWAATADGVQHIGFVALDTEERILAHAVCVRLYGSRAEVAVEVDEDHRNLGLATLLLRRVAREAEHQGVRRLIAEVLPENRDMLGIFRDGFAAVTTVGRDEIDVEFPTSSWRTAHARLEPETLAEHPRCPFGLRTSAPRNI
jgi:GNAT superfamily N-acetyltransferase